MNNEIFDSTVETAEALIWAKENGWTYTHFFGERRLGTNSSLTFKKGDLEVTVDNLENMERELWDAEDRKNNPDKYDPPPPTLEYMNRTRKRLNRAPLTTEEEAWVQKTAEAWSKRNPHREYPSGNLKPENYEI